MGRLDQKVALVTGGNSGIGEATAKLFAREGAAVIITARREDELKRVADEITVAGGTCTYVPGDVRVTADVNHVVQQAVEAYGRIDILVNNAGIPDDQMPTVRLTDEFWNNVVDTDLTGVMRFSRAVLPHMVERNAGAIVNIASIGGVYACAGASYSAAKAGVLALTKNLAIQYYGSGIRINSVSPGPTDTPLFSPRMAEAADREMMKITARSHYHKHPNARLDPMEQAYVILFLASDEASGVNGENITVDYGGWL